MYMLTLATYDAVSIFVLRCSGPLIHTHIFYFMHSCHSLSPIILIDRGTTPLNHLPKLLVAIQCSLGEPDQIFFGPKPRSGHPTFLGNIVCKVGEEAVM